MTASFEYQPLTPGVIMLAYKHTFSESRFAWLFVVCLVNAHSCRELQGHRRNGKGKPFFKWEIMQHQLSHSATDMWDRSQHLLLLLDQHKHYSSDIWSTSDQTSCSHFSVMASPLVQPSRVPTPPYVPTNCARQKSCITAGTLFIFCLI